MWLGYSKLEQRAGDWRRITRASQPAVRCTFPDEFFVPALEVITERFGIDEDVAGASIMAAGGSAPELATSFIGTFVSKSSVGFAAIVGSAVFNVLFVIGCCSFFALSVLELTWWPLFRDSMWYLLSLSTLYACFYDNKVYWWQSLILLGLYVGYLLIMANNTKLYHKAKRVREALCSRHTKAVAPSPSTAEAAAAAGFQEASDGNEGDGSGMARTRTTFTAGVLHMLLTNVDPRGRGVNVDKDNRFQRSAQIVVEQVRAARLMAMAGRRGSQAKPAQMLVSAAMSMHSEDTAGADAELGKAVPGALLPADDQAEKSDPTGSTADAVALPSQADLTAADDSADEEPTGDERDFFRWPNGWKARVLFVITAPLAWSLAFTVPDVRVPGRAKLWPITFGMSIAWIAVYSWLMVWWATVAGEAMNIPDSVMGLTFLAAGTSVPDLVTSVLVARNGFGDMAVSSSIGSNIFDVLIGLPLPWIAYSMVNGGEPVHVGNAGLTFSLFVLVIMLALVVITIAAFKWRMTRGMGAAMFALYVVFVIITLLLEFDVMDPPF